jgi:short-subunit dehydrogenase
VTTLQGMVCLVTGATGAIGGAVLEALALRGARSVAAGRDERRLRELELPSLALDLALPGAGQLLADRALALAGHIDVLVNCAGVGMYGPVASLDDQAFERMLAVNLTAPVELTHALLPPMLERGAGHVVHVGSVLSHFGRRSEAGYAATKAALACFTTSLRAELHGTGVGVSLVSPGVVQTPFFERRAVPYDRRWPRPIPPRQVADAVVQAIVHNRAEILVPRWLALPSWLSGTVPSLYRVLTTRLDEPRRHQHA